MESTFLFNIRVFLWLRKIILFIVLLLWQKNQTKVTQHLARHSTIFFPAMINFCIFKFAHPETLDYYYYCFVDWLAQKNSPHFPCNKNVSCLSLWCKISVLVHNLTMNRIARSLSIACDKNKIKHFVLFVKLCICL